MNIDSKCAVKKCGVLHNIKLFKILAPKLLLLKLLKYTIVSRLQKRNLACKETIMEFVCSALLEFKLQSS